MFKHFYYNLWQGKGVIMKKIVILLLLAGLVLGNLACDKEIIIDDPLTENGEEGTDDPGVSYTLTPEEIAKRNQQNYMSGGGFFAVVDGRVFYVIYPTDGKKNTEKLIEVTADGDSIIIDKQNYIDIYVDGDILHILTTIEGKNDDLLCHEYSYDLKTNELQEIKSPVKDYQYLKMTGSERFYLEYAKGSKENIYANGKKLLSAKYGFDTVYVTADSIYYVDSSAENYGLNRYDLETAKSELILPIKSEILEIIYGYYIRSVNISYLMMEDDYIVYIKGENKIVVDDDDMDEEERYAALACRQLSNPAGDEVLLTAMVKLGEDDDTLNVGYTVANGKVYYYDEKGLRQYDLKTKTDLQLLMFDDGKTPFFYIAGVNIGMDGTVYLDTSGGLYKMDQSGNNLQEVYHHSYAK